MKYLIFPLLLVSLAACGVDGEPTPPESPPKPGLTISGTAQFILAGRL